MPDVSLQLERCIIQFLVLTRFCEDMHMLPFRMVEPDVQSFASFLTFRKMLDQQACGKMSLPFVGAHGDPHKARYLLRLDEIMLRGGGKRGAFQRDDTLITLTRYCLVESDRKIDRKSTRLNSSN